MTFDPRKSRTARSSSRLLAGRAFHAFATCLLAGALGLGAVLGGCTDVDGAAIGNENIATASLAKATRAFTAMDTGMALTVHAADQAAAEDAAEACEQRIRELDELLAPAGSESELARANAAGGTPTAVSASVLALASEALDVAHETEGAFDPTVYPLTNAWGFTDGDHRVPSPDERAALLPRVGFEAVHVDAAAETLTLTNEAQIDMGGVAKGFAADELSALLRERGVASALFDLGGNVTAFGSKPAGSAWKVGIADPNAPDQLAGTLELCDATASTSGAYQRFFDEDGTRYHHLLDPATGYPAASDLASVTVVGANGARCDALSTACYVMGLDRSLDLWHSVSASATDDKAFDLVLIADDGSVYATAGIADSFAPSSAYSPATKVERR